jgi:hypothetical protein
MCDTDGLLIVNSIIEESIKQVNLLIDNSPVKIVDPPVEHIEDDDKDPSD